ncbi:MAG: zinc-binding dehydrogenase [Candidatus Hydrogenedentes bacterium]|nr:zinc-binding dehydrogenase [Candidatus Hydrogenedentota bacterium]
MKALQINGPGECEVKEVPTPEPGPGEVLLKVHAVTTCPHWDMHILGGEPMFPGMELEYPYTLGQPGHEACGEVAALGKGVTEFEVGQRVCAWRDRGHHVQGCYAQYVAMDPESLIPVPTELPPEACAPLELAMCASAHLMLAEKLEAVEGRRVGVFGLGPAGLLFVQLARAAGAAEVIGFDPLDARRELAARLGATRALDPAGEEARTLPPRGQAGCLDTAFDCVGSPAAVHRAMELTLNLLVLFAVQREPYTFGPALWSRFMLAGAQPHTRAAAEYAVARLAAGQLDMSPLVTHTMTLDEYARGVELLKQRDAIKVAFLPQES